MKSAVSRPFSSAVAYRTSAMRIAHYDMALPSSLVELLWQRPETVVDHGETLQRSGLRWTTLLRWSGRQYVLKRYQPDWWHATKGLVQASPAWSTWTTTIRLVEAGVATPRPVACVEDRWGGLRRSSFLMYPYVAGRTLRSLLSNEAKESRPLADDLWRQLGELWLQLSQIHASLADTNTGNFIVDPEGRVWAIDLDKACFHSSAQSAGRQLQRGWQQLVRSAAKC